MKSEEVSWDRQNRVDALFRLVCQPLPFFFSATFSAVCFYFPQPTPPTSFILAEGNVERSGGCD